MTPPLKPWMLTCRACGKVFTQERMGRRRVVCGDKACALKDRRATRAPSAIGELRAEVEEWKRRFDQQLPRVMKERDEAREEAERLRGALEELMGWQNGPPLITYTEGWTAAMEKARRALSGGKP